ncbi:VWA-like domain-containing protein, partial [Thioalkalicoccus limnaeus]
DLWPSDQTDDIAREAEQMRDWSERILRAHASDGEQSLLRALIADRPRARIPWEAILRTRMRRALARRVDLSWSRPARSYVANRGRAGPGRRLPWEPGTTTSRAVPRLVIIVDVSGSIDDSLLGRFAREVEAITRRLEARLAILIGDRKVSRIEHFVPGRTRLRELLFQGGGGTDFTPLLEAADALRPDLVLVLTDLQGPANVRPRWPVIWAVPASVPDPQPLFGTLVRLD